MEVFLSTGTVFAYDTSSFDNLHYNAIVENNDEASPSRRTTCLSCGNGEGVTICTGENLKIESGYHRNILGIQTDCFAYYYYRKGIEMCLDCGAFIRTLPGYHLCLEVHPKCGKGSYNCCVMDMKLSDVEIKK